MDNMVRLEKFKKNPLFIITAIPLLILGCVSFFYFITTITSLFTNFQEFTESGATVFELITGYFSGAMIDLGNFLLYIGLGIGFALFYYFVKQDKALKNSYTLIKILSIAFAAFKIINYVFSQIYVFIHSLLNDYSVGFNFSSLLKTIIVALMFFFLFKFIVMLEKSEYNKTICLCLIVCSVLSALPVIYSFFDYIIFPQFLPINYLPVIRYLAVIVFYVLLTIIGIKYMMCFADKKDFENT